jgi:hypothetical protein
VPFVDGDAWTASGAILGVEATDPDSPSEHPADVAASRKRPRVTRPGRVRVTSAFLIVWMPFEEVVRGDAGKGWRRRPDDVRMPAGLRGPDRSGGSVRFRFGTLATGNTVARMKPTVGELRNVVPIRPIRPARIAKPGCRVDGAPSWRCRERRIIWNAGSRCCKIETVISDAPPIKAIFVPANGGRVVFRNTLCVKD